MHYSANVIIPVTGSIRGTGLGGDAFCGPRTKGYNAPFEIGVIAFKTPIRGDDLSKCRAVIQGYEGGLIADVALPNHVFTEFPVTWEIVGPPGTTVLVEAHTTTTTGADRGAKSSYYKPAAVGVVTIPIPPWATSVDMFGAASATSTFGEDSSLGVVCGEIVGVNVVGLSIPDRATHLRITSGANYTVVWRQL